MSIRNAANIEIEKLTSCSRQQPKEEKGPKGRRSVRTTQMGLQMVNGNDRRNRAKEVACSPLLKGHAKQQALRRRARNAAQKQRRKSYFIKSPEVTHRLGGSADEGKGVVCHAKTG
jgi:hypothetical protein